MRRPKRNSLRFGKNGAGISLPNKSNSARTILHSIGFDQQKLTYGHNGHDFALPNLRGEVVKEILAQALNSQPR